MFRTSTPEQGRGLGGAAHDALDLAERRDGAGRHGRPAPPHLGRHGPRLRRPGRVRQLRLRAGRRLCRKGRVEVTHSISYKGQRENLSKGVP